MKEFQLVNAASVEEAIAVLNSGKGMAKAMAGGTDLLGGMKRKVYPAYPETVVNLQNIPGMTYIKEENGVLKIGAMTKLVDITENEVVKEKYAALAEAARRTASPQLRNMGTIAGNICQENRCWYFRATDNYFDCIRKGGSICYAIEGDNRYHSIFGGVRVEGLPCTTDCPSSIHIPDYLTKVREGDLAGAAALLLETNPLPAMTGRVCPHFCENNCNRSAIDKAVSIRDLERSVGDYILEHAHELIKAPVSESGKIIAVIGSGPAGLSAAFFLRRMGHRVTVIDAKEEAGGMLTYAIPAYRLPKDIVKKQVNAFKAMGIEFKMNTRIGQEIKLENLMTYYDAVFMACGSWKEKPTGIKGEELLMSGLKFLGDVASGHQKPLVDTQIICSRGACTELVIGMKDIAVLGGGNTAIDVARTLQRLGADPVIVYRRTKVEMPAIAHDVNLAIEEGIKIQFLTQPLEVSKNGSKMTLTCSKMELGEADASGRRRPVAVPCSEFSMDFDSVITAFGEDADTSFVPEKYLNKSKWLEVDSNTYAGANLFGGGDYVSGPSTVTQAMADGKKAAQAINKYLGGEECSCENKCDNILDLSHSCMEKANRAVAPQLAVRERIINLTGEDVSSLTQETFDTEAKRCLNCGCVAVNCSDIAPALVALDAQIVTTKRTIPAENFWSPNAPGSTVLDYDELVTEIRMPIPTVGTKSAFIKFATRGTIDFPIVNCAVVIGAGDAKICLNAVHPKPYRAYKAEEIVKGKAIAEDIAEAAGEAAVSTANTLENNKFKVQVAKVIVKRTILACK